MLKFKWITKFFKRKKIVFSKNYMSAEFERFFVANRKKYVRIAFTNRIKYKGSIPMTDIPLSDVRCIKILPSPIKKGIYNLLGLRAKPTFFKFK